ncbi:hypothetical protein DACRYDRAFT_113459 [Dacryopinax primogenitus]|uniref:FIST domain-containing protein n=1 Tax=Dacryopinax primogenitus (strain DJM 731) TaxID=1858805 RepID=M5G4W0_DACPD|nr:uncharacterized protein DACRYDRAFT_113459 [Dacryopinax primogenitus]EJU05301.1 hypothetical protein DACRYDRAFT_113459 [Dacryopinax primogenitus]
MNGHVDDGFEPLVNTIRDLSPKHSGCLSAPIPSAPSKIACSISLFPRSQCNTVRTTIPGRKKPQVGRWRIDEPEGRSYAVGSDRYISRQSQAKFELGALDGAAAFVFFSDDMPEGLMDALDYQVPRRIAKLGMISASTPFVTERPFTLFHDQKIYDSGAVGISLKCDVPPRQHVMFQGYTSISSSVQVTDARGNLLHRLNDTSPTQFLLDCIPRMQQRGASQEQAESGFLSKEDEFFVGIPFDVEPQNLQTGYQRVYRITSGDPAKGTMALDADDGPPIGTRVQFLRRSGAWEAHIKRNEDRSLLYQFQSTSDELPPVVEQSLSRGAEHPDMTVVENVFCAASEHGFVSNSLPGMPMGRGRCWRTSVLGAEAELSSPQ